VDIADGAGVAIDEHGQLPHVQVTVYLTRRQHRTNGVRQFLLGSPGPLQSGSSAVRVLGSQRSRRDSSTVAATGQAPAPRALAAIA
jgi:outer membrane receptor for ferrienterochelin and colicin